MSTRTRWRTRLLAIASTCALGYLCAHVLWLPHDPGTAHPQRYESLQALDQQRVSSPPSHAHVPHECARDVGRARELESRVCNVRSTWPGPQGPDDPLALLYTLHHAEHVLRVHACRWLRLRASSGVHVSLCAYPSGGDPCVSDAVAATGAYHAYEVTQVVSACQRWEGLTAQPGAAPLFIDVGANLGVFSLVRAQSVRAVAGG